MPDNSTPKVPTANEDISFERFEDLVHNVISLRREFFQRYLDPRRNIDKECGFPDSLTAEQYYDLYTRDAIAARVVECVPRAVWQKQPTIYEDDGAEEDTEFECAWDELGKCLRGERSFYQDEEGNPVMAVMEKADILSSIGQYGVILLGLDDGRDLREPVEGVEELFSVPAESLPEKRGDDRAQDEDPNADLLEEDARDDEGKARAQRDRAKRQAVRNAEKSKPFKGGVYSMTWNAGRRACGSFSLKLNAYVPPKSPRDMDGTDDYQEFPDDPREPDEVESNFDDAPEEGSGRTRKLLYLRAFPESQAQIVRYETNPTSPRYGQPIHYLITFNDSRDQNWRGMRVSAPMTQKLVHWTRVVHIPAEGSRYPEVFGDEALLQVYRNILSLQKIVHGGGEMFWKGAFPGISFETHPQLGGQVVFDETSAKRKLEDYQNGLQRFLLAAGFSAKTLSPTVVDPTPHIDAQLKIISIRKAIPMRKLMGSERGELASGQDDGDWDDVVRAWQVNDRNPRIIIPLVDRLINVGALPEPSGYSIDWPDITVQNETERAQIALTLTQAMTAYISGNGASFMPPMEYLTKIWQMDEAEACAIVDAAEAVLEQQKAEEEQALYDQMDAQEEQIERGLIPDPNDPDLVPEGAPLPNGFPPKPGAPTDGPPPPNGFPPKEEKNGATPPPFARNQRKTAKPKKGARRAK